MKKKMLSIVLTFCLLFSLVPAVHAEENDAVSVANEADLLTALSGTCTVIDITADIALNNTLVINRAVTINGGTAKNTLSKANTDSSNYVIQIAADGVTLNNLTVEGDYAVIDTANHAVVQNCDVKATRIGVQFYPAAAISSPKITVENCVIQNTNQESPYNVDYSTDNRGLSTYQVKGGTVTISDSQILGFKYGINPVIDEKDPGTDTLRDGEGTEFDVADTTVWGWAALNIWSANTNYTFTNCTLTGVNKFSSGANSFATIVANDDIYNGNENYACSVKIIGGNVNVQQYGSMTQSTISVDNSCLTDFEFSWYAAPDNQIYPVIFDFVIQPGSSYNVLSFHVDDTQKINEYMDPETGHLTGIYDYVYIFYSYFESAASRMMNSAAEVFDPDSMSANQLPSHEGGLMA